MKIKYPLEVDAVTDVHCDVCNRASHLGQPGVSDVLGTLRLRCAT